MEISKIQDVANKIASEMINALRGNLKEFEKDISSKDLAFSLFISSINIIETVYREEGVNEEMAMNIMKSAANSISIKKTSNNETLSAQH